MNDGIFQEGNFTTNIPDSDGLNWSANELYNDNDVNGYKIRCGKWYKIYSSTYNGVTFYRIPVTKKEVDGTKTRAYKVVNFPRMKMDEEIPNGSFIRPLRLFENFFTTEKTGKYVPIWCITICEWELRLPEVVKTQRAIKEYTSNVVSKNIEDMDLTQMLPF